MIHRFHAALLLGMARVLAEPVPAFAQALPEGSAHLREVAEHDHERAEEQEVEIIVQGTRLGRRLQHEPLRVEVIAGEEIEEKALMRPGNIAMLVNEIGGVRVQVTSPALGAANVRIQGLEGRYTQLRHSWPEVSRNPMPCLVSMPFGVIALLVFHLGCSNFPRPCLCSNNNRCPSPSFRSMPSSFRLQGQAGFLMPVPVPIG